MRHILILLFFFCAGSLLGQNTNELEKNNSQSINNTISTGEAYTDSTILNDFQIIQVPQPTEKKTKATKKDVKTKSELPSNEESLTVSESTRSISSMSGSFNGTKVQSSTQRTQRTPTYAQQQQMNVVVDALEESAPESFEYHYYKYLAGNYNIALIDHLKKAEGLKPNNSDVHLLMVAYYLIMNDTKNANLYLEKLSTSSRLSKEAIDYSEDILRSVRPGGTLITHGTDDTYGTAFIQISKKIRPDVRIISLDLLQSDKYRENLKSNGYSIPDSRIVDVQFLQQFCIKNSSMNICVSMTTPKEYLVGIQQNLFTVGLNFEYHTDLSFSNFKRNEELWYKDLVKTVSDNATNEKSKQLSANYLPMLLVLRKVYEQKNESEKLNDIDRSIDKIAAQCNKYEQVQKLKKSY
ncbi:MAG: tetratricopeptide repeat protein [Flavobacteriales bacterium]